MQKYYHISLKWTAHNDEAFKFFGPDNNGYTYVLEHAGVYDKDWTNFNEGIISIPVEMIEAFKVEVTNKDTREKLHMCPNRGFIRKAFGITTYDMSSMRQKDMYLQSEYVLFDIHNEVLEKSKKVKSGFYRVEMKHNDNYEEIHYYNSLFEGKNRNEAIMKAYKEWDGYYECTKGKFENSYLNFKNIVSATINYEYVFERWETI